MKQSLKSKIMLILLLFSSGLYAQNWQLVWSDEFNTGISSDWVFETGGGGWGNNELEYYRQENASVQNGKLVLTAKNEYYGGMNYTSVRMKTQGKKSWKYGKIEASIAMPSFQGVWPAFWMLGDNISSVGWPSCGEIDIMEHVNTESQDHGTIHWYNGGHQQYTNSTYVNNITAYHTYTVIWDANSITWFLDGVQYSQANIANNINNTGAFHNNFFILLNLAIGGDWPGNAVDNSAFPANMYVDYVRVYQDSPIVSTTGLVTVYKDCNYGGFSGGLGVGDYTTSQLNALGVQDNDISSLRVTEGYKAILYDGDNFTGASTVITTDNSCVGGWNDITSSIQIRPNGDPNKAGTYFLQNRNSGLFMDVSGGLSATGDGANIQQWTSNNQANQQFQFTHLGDGVYKVLASHSMKSIDVDAISTTDGANVQQWTYYGTANQQFIVYPTPDGFYKLIAKHSGKVVEVAGAQTNAGANVQQWTNNNQICGQWKFIAPTPVNGSGDGLAGSYFNGMNFETPVYSRKDGSISFDWGSGSPNAKVNADAFSIRWTGQIQPRYSGIYTFYMNSDNGRRLWINNQLIIDKWIDDWGTEYTGTITLTAGQKYDIKVEYFEDYGGASCKLEWSSGLQGREVVPQSQLYSNAVPSVSITSPANSANFLPPASVAIASNVSDSDGSISKVDYYNGSSLLASTTSPYNYNWSGLAVGAYTIAAVAYDNKGAFTISSPVAFTVKNNPTISFANVTKTYGDASFGVSATSNSTGAITYSITSGSQYATITSGGQVTIKGAGTVTVQASQVSTTDYNSETATATITINKAALTATADNKSRTYHTANPAFTITYSGFVYGETSSVLSSLPTASTSATQTSNVGTYPIALSGGAADNYNVTLVSGTLTITKATPTLTYTGATSGMQGTSIALSATSNSTGAISYSVTNGTGRASISGSSLDLTSAGTVTLTVSVAATSNYKATNISQTITIDAPVNPSITFGDITKTYGDAPFTVSATSDSPGAINYSITSGSQYATITSDGLVTISGAGTVTILATQAAVTGFNSGTAIATLTINKSDNFSFDYTGSTSGTVGTTIDLIVSSSSSGSVSYHVISGGSGSAIVNGSTLVLTGAGVITIEITIAGDDNHNSKTITQDITITGVTAIFSGNSFDISIDAFPNPAADYVTIRFKGLNKVPSKIGLYDVEGKEIYSLESTDSNFGSGEVTIPMFELSGGLYIIKVETEDGVAVRKINK